MTTITANNKTVIETIAELKKAKINLGMEEIEFPNGHKEKFYYNGEEDKQAAINFAQICYNATNDTYKAKQMMQTCFLLLTKGINPDEMVEARGTTYYIDHDKKILCNSNGSTVAELTEDEQDITDKKAISAILKARAGVRN